MGSRRDRARSSSRSNVQFGKTGEAGRLASSGLPEEMLFDAKAAKDREELRPVLAKLFVVLSARAALPGIQDV